MLLACASVLLGLAGSATGGLLSKKAHQQKAQLVCVGGTRYQFGKNAWASQESGTVPIVLPVNVQTDKFPCQLLVPDMGTFQANTNTQFTLTMDESKQFQLTIQHGAVFYSLTNGATMRITSPLPGVGANVAGSDGKTTNGAWSSLPKEQSLGQTSFSKDNLFELVNMNGRVHVDRKGRTVRNVGQGHTLYISLAQQSGLATTGTTANNVPVAYAPSTAARGYIFRENPNQNVMGFIQPTGSGINTVLGGNGSNKIDGEVFAGGYWGGIYPGGNSEDNTSNEQTSPY